MIYNRKTSQPESPWGSLVTLLLSIKITGKMLKHCYFNGHRDKTPDILAEAFGKEAPDAIWTGWGWHKPEPWTLSGCDGFWALTAVPGGLCQICDFSAPYSAAASAWLPRGEAFPPADSAWHLLLLRRHLCPVPLLSGPRQPAFPATSQQLPGQCQALQCTSSKAECSEPSLLISAQEAALYHYLLKCCTESQHSHTDTLLDRQGSLLYITGH